MAADAAGNDLLNVFIPVTGYLAFAPAGTTLPTPAEMGTYGYTPPATWTRAGLITVDGGFGWSENRAESKEFFQGGYQKNAGNGTASLAVKLAETSANVRQLLRNATADANGVIDVDIDADVQWALYTEEVDSIGRIRRRVGGNCWLATNEADRSTRGEISGSEATFTVRRDAALSNKHFREAVLEVDSTPAPYIASVLPSGKAPGDVVTVAGAYFGSDISAFTIDGVAVAKYAASADGRTISALIPAGVSGAAAVVVTTTSGGASNSYAYTAA